MSSGQDQPESLVVAVDGPAGAGKSTLSRALAEKLDLEYLNTGATFRAFAVYAQDRQVTLSEEGVATALEDFSLEIEGDAVLVNGAPVQDRLRDEAIGTLASKLAPIGSLRTFLLQWQREYAQRGNMVMEGRDIGSKVLPWAPVKFFVTASAETRAQRRVQQLAEQGISADYNEVLSDIRSRDDRDTNRTEAPLVHTPDALLVDTSGQTINHSLSLMLDFVKAQTGR